MSFHKCFIGHIFLLIIWNLSCTKVKMNQNTNRSDHLEFNLKDIISSVVDGWMVWCLSLLLSVTGPYRISSYYAFQCVTKSKVLTLCKNAPKNESEATFRLQLNQGDNFTSNLFSK